MRARGPASYSVLPIACALLSGCAGIIPAVAGETGPTAAMPAAPAARTVQAPAPLGGPATAPLAEVQAVSPPATQAAPAVSPPVNEQSGFARFVRYAEAAARSARSGDELPSALLSDPIALDGKRRRCAVGEQLVAVIDLDPVGGVFAPPTSPTAAPDIALSLTALRKAGLEITWISDLPTERSGSVRTALEQSGLDPRGQDIISLRRAEGDSKDQRKTSLGGFACIVAIAGDERPDFDSRFKYLRSPQAGAAIETLVGDGWFLVDPLFGN